MLSQIHDSVVVSSSRTVIPRCRRSAYGRWWLLGLTGWPIAASVISGSQSSGCRTAYGGYLQIAHDVLFNAVHPVQVAVERILTSVLLAALRANDEGVLTPQVDVLDVAFQAHFVEIFVTIVASFTRISILFGWRWRGWRNTDRAVV